MSLLLQEKKKKQTPILKILGFADVLLDVLCSCSIQTTFDECQEGYADLCCESATADNMWLPDTRNTSPYTGKASAAEHHPIILVGLQTSLVCP